MPISVIQRTRAIGVPAFAAEDRHQSFAIPHAPQAQIPIVSKYFQACRNFRLNFKQPEPSLPAKAKQSIAGDERMDCFGRFAPRNDVALRTCVRILAAPCVRGLAELLSV